MKKKIIHIKNTAVFLTAALLGLMSPVFAQNLGISATGSLPDNSALLDVDATGMNPKKGILIPRMTTAERNAIPSPAHSLLIFNTTTNCFEMYNATVSAWQSLGCMYNCTSAPPAPSSITGPTLACYPTVYSYSIAPISSATTYNWTLPAGWTLNTGINTNSITVTSSATSSVCVSAQNPCGVSASTCMSVTVTQFSCLSAWLYRLPITINNPNSTAVTNFQVGITINTQALITAGKMQSNGNDIRFTDGSCNVLNHWIESGINTPSTLIWVKVPSIPASGSTTIYMYYGNAAAPNIENPAVVFDFWEDFNGSTLPAIWTAEAGASYTIGGSILRVNTGSIWLNTVLPFFLNNGYFLEGKMRFYATSTGSGMYPYSGNLEANSAMAGGCGGNVCGNAVIHYMRGGGVQHVAVWVGTGATASYDVNNGTFCWISADLTWYIMGEKILSNQVFFQSNYTNMCNTGLFSWSKNLAWIQIGYFSTGVYDEQDTDYDWIRCRKALPTDPTVSIGTEVNNC